MLIVIANTKGGSGKSTVAINLAGYAASNGQQTALLDADPQGTIADWQAVREDMGRSFKNIHVQMAPDHLHGLQNATDAQVAEIRQWMRDRKELAGAAILDVGGFDSLWMRAAMLEADKVIIPLAPDSLNIWAVSNTVIMWNHAVSAGAEGKAYFLINKAAPKGGRNEEAREVLKEDWPTIGQLSAQLVNRVAFSEATGLGGHALESSDMKAQQEIKALGKEVFRSV